MSMFLRARLKLTLWYVTIALAISLAFSTAIYGFLVEGIQRFARMQRARIERRLEHIPFLDPELRVSSEQHPVDLADPELELETIQRLQIILILINGSVFVLSAGLCYFVAGQTLKPIQKMVTQQQRFISDASHELKTPLTALRTTFEVALRDKNLTLTEAKDVLTQNLEEVEHMQLLSEALLKLSTYQNISSEHFSPQRLDEVVERVVKNLTPLARKKQMSFTVELLPVQVSAIQQQLNELCTILIDNAVKYGNKKTKIFVTMIKTQTTAKLSIKNTGVGITAADLPHIFDRFYRADLSRSKTTVNGYGLGLAIAQQIVELHHGRIDVQSTPDHDTLFIVSFPLLS